MTPNLSAFLQVIRHCEGTAGPDGYSLLFGGEKFYGFQDHPRVIVERGRYRSSAAGAYQILQRTWDWFISKNGPHDFSPDNQDLCARWLIDQRKATGDIEAGRFDEAIAKCNKEWASLPGSPYGQPTRTLEYCRKVYVQNGGTFTEHEQETVTEQNAGYVATETVPEVGTPVPNVGTPTEQRVEPFSVMSLVSALVQGFSPLIRAKVEKTVGTEVGKPLADSLLQAATQLTGKPDALEAVAVARKNPEVVAQLEQTATDWFATMAPALDKLEQLEEREHQRAQSTMDAGQERWTGKEFDPAPLLTYFAIGAVGAITAFLGVYIGIAKGQGKPVTVEEWAALTGLIGWITAKAGSIYDNRFGTTRQSAAKDVVIGQMARKL